jgi:hypothetical protein
MPDMELRDVVCPADFQCWFSLIPREFPIAPLECLPYAIISWQCVTLDFFAFYQGSQFALSLRDDFGLEHFNDAQQLRLWKLVVMYGLK